MTDDQLPTTAKRDDRGRKALDPLANAAGTMPCYSVNVLGFELGLHELVDELDRQATAVARGDLSRPESMLLAQAHTLDAIFCKLMVMARENMFQDSDKVERYMRIALKAQGQCRATLEALAGMKNPPVVIARQANVANGPQQVNNDFTGAILGEPARNKLLEQSHGERLDFGTAGQAIGSDPAMATVGAIHRPENGGR